MSSHPDDATDARPAERSAEAPLFDEIAPLRLAIAVVFAAFATYAIYVEWISLTSPDVVGVVLLSVVFLAGGFVPFNTTLAYYVSQSAAFLLWGVLRLSFSGFDLIPVLLGGFGAIGLVVYGRRALRDGLRTRV